ncbi:protein adenylyltransferase SelO [Thiomicrorhabdus lithotrophica]|uniref:Protein nucleotidyltransferase YdiU n=1 Tax=Thiomicrorhabdus lithotrophica TaxID=2949997 RepID=A0ABY8CAU8_9GAMM|nr:YdiU family protein [Thiomicrorhabdus lithotrophica]WEJ63089.1 YdiU family protein [Thiomicrorhabdus lithotrophica]
MAKSYTAKFQQNYIELPDSFYAKINPEAMQNASLIHYNKTLCDELGIELSEQVLFDMTTGQSFPEGLEPLAQKYTGHQFGYYNPDLGDGRGVLLGQITDNQKQNWDIHLKGSGRTPFSRRGDGRAVLRSAVREYLIGEALHALGVPTTRCLSICNSPEPVQREQIETRATYIRIAKTHIRFGHFEWLAQKGNIEEQQQLADHVIESVYPELKSITDSKERYGKLLKSITRNTASMIAGWQSVGFCHGVMNTDNMSVAGETFDFGPYAFLDDCQIHYICNHSDTEGRYAYSQQPNIGLWNCQVLGQAFSHLVDSDAIEAAIDTYIETFNQQYLQKMSAKFGLIQPEPEDKHFIADTLILMDQSKLDFHYFFTLLTHFDTEQHALFESYILDSKDWQVWQERYRKRISEQSEVERQACLKQNVPLVTLRNYIAQEIIEASLAGNVKPLENWMDWLTTPTKPNETLLSSTHKHYLKPPTACQKGLALSCSS